MLLFLIIYISFGYKLICILMTLDFLQNNLIFKTVSFIYLYMYGPPHMAVQKQDDQHKCTFSNYVRIRDVVQRTCLRRWTIGKSGERESGISVLPAQHDDDDDDIYIYIYICMCVSVCVYIYIYIYTYLHSFFKFIPKTVLNQ